MGLYSTCGTAALSNPGAWIVYIKGVEYVLLLLLKRISFVQDQPSLRQTGYWIKKYGFMVLDCHNKYGVGLKGLDYVRDLFGLIVDPQSNC